MWGQHGGAGIAPSSQKPACADTPCLHPTRQAPVCAEGMLRPVRIAVHIRAGDAENDGNRLLPHAFYFAVIRALAKVGPARNARAHGLPLQQLPPWRACSILTRAAAAAAATATTAQELRRLQRDYVVEVYTQAAHGIQHHSNGSHERISGEAYVQRLHANIGRHMLLLADMDVLWSLGQMASADVLVHSKSTLSIVAGILNTKVGGWVGAV